MSFGGRCLRSSLFCLALTLTLIVAATAAAQQAGAFDPVAADARLEEIQSGLASDEPDPGWLDGVRADAVAISAAANRCHASASEERTRLETRFEPLRDIQPDVETAVFEERNQVLNQLNAAIERQTLCAGLRDDAGELVERITAAQTRISQRFLLHRTESIVGALRDLPAQLAVWPRNIRTAVDLEPAAGMSANRLLWLLLAAGLLAAVAGVYLRQRFTAWYDARGGGGNEHAFRFLFLKPLAQYAPLLLEGIVLWLLLLFGIANASFDLVVVRLAAGIVLFGLLCTVIDWATGPLSPSADIKGLIPDHVRPLRLRLRFFALTLVASFVVLGTDWLSIRLLDPSVAGRATMISAVAIALIVVLAYLGRIPGLRHRYRLVRWGGILVLTAGILSVLLGYHNLAGYLIHGATRTAIALMLLWVLLWLVYQGFQFLMQPESTAATRLRRSLGVRRASSRSGIGFLQLVADLVLWLCFVVFLIYVWDESGTTLDRLYELINFGGTIGGIELVPRRIIGGILVFAAVIVLIGWIKRWIEARWLQHIVAERGAREALVTLIGYVGFVVAVLVGLVQAGVDLSGLAIVSGALALGIGFGMQEIANNFVSGLILLFERPIRAGDFVTVGDTEGFVRRIRIRATEIETLDNQNVLVPNSELISGRVTNWVLRDPQGRLILRVGVAYGSDVQKVRDILQRIASEHPDVITDGTAPAPRALFMGFGDSSLDFELRVRIKRIERRFTVLSDLNFRIDQAFREADITIPFPQRDLHVVSWQRRPQATDKPESDSAKASGAESRPSGPAPAHEAQQLTRSLTESVQVSSSLQDTWQALTDIDVLKRWLATDGEFRPFIGGKFALSLRDESDMRGRIDIFLPPRRMRLVIAPRENEQPLASGPITVDFLLAGNDEDTRTEVTVTVAGIPASEDWEMDYRRAEVRWREAFVELKELLAPK